MQKQRQQKKNNKNDSGSFTITMIILFIFTILLLGAAITTFVLNTQRIIGVIILLLLFFLLKGCFAKDECSTCETRKPWYRFLKVIIYALFIKLPIRENKNLHISSTIPIRYSFKKEKDSQSTSNVLKKDDDEGNKKTRRYVAKHEFDYAKKKISLPKQLS